MVLRKEDDGHNDEVIQESVEILGEHRTIDIYPDGAHWVKMMRGQPSEYYATRSIQSQSESEYLTSIFPSRLGYYLGILPQIKIINLSSIRIHERWSADRFGNADLSSRWGTLPISVVGDLNVDGITRTGSIIYDLYFNSPKLEPTAKGWGKIETDIFSNPGNIGNILEKNGIPDQDIIVQDWEEYFPDNPETVDPILGLQTWLSQDELLTIPLVDQMVSQGELVLPGQTRWGLGVIIGGQRYFFSLAEFQPKVSTRDPILPI